MNRRLLSVTILVSGLVVIGHPVAAGQGAGRGRAATTPASRASTRADHKGATASAPRGGTVVQTRPPRPTAGRPATGPRLLVGPLAIVVPESPDPDAPGPVDPVDALARSPAIQHPESSTVQPLPRSAAPPSGSAARGTLRLDVRPATAQVFVDGFYVGTVDDLASAVGLSLAAGWHRLEFRAPGYVTPAINVTIEADRAASYRGELTPVR